MISYRMFAAAALVGAVSCPAAAVAQEVHVSVRLFPFTLGNQSPLVIVEPRGAPTPDRISLPSFALSKTDRGPQLNGLLMALPAVNVGTLALVPRYGDHRFNLNFLPSALPGMSIDPGPMRGLAIATTAGPSSWTLMLGQRPTASANLVGSGLPQTLALSGTIKSRRRISIAPRLVTRLGSGRPEAARTSLGSGMRLDATSHVALIADLGVARKEPGTWAQVTAAGAIGRWSRAGFEAGMLRGDRGFTLFGGVPFAEDREMVAGRVLLDRGVALSGQTSASRPADTHASRGGRLASSLALTVERLRAGRFVVSDERSTDASRRQQRLQVEWRHRHKDALVVRYFQRQETAGRSGRRTAADRFELDVRALSRRGGRVTADARALMVIAPVEHVPLLTSRVNARFVSRRVRLGSEAEIAMFQVPRFGGIRTLRLTSETPLLRDTSVQLTYGYQHGALLPLARRLEARLTRVVLARKGEQNR